VRHLPNLITCIRLGLLPWFAAVTLQGDRAMAIVLVAVIAFSDWLDGWLARRFHLTTKTGAVLDPLADKLCQVTALLVLTAHQAPEFTRIPSWFTALVFGRDLLLTYGALRIRRSRRKVVIRPLWSGKLSTLLVFVIVFGALLNSGSTAMLVACLLTSPFVITAAVQYTLAGHSQLASASAPST